MMNWTWPNIAKNDQFLNGCSRPVHFSYVLHIN